MDFQKSKALLEKINALYRNISGDPRNISSIERDLMKTYVQQFYESFLEMPTVAASVAPPPPPPVEPKSVEPKITLRRPETPAPPPPPRPEPVKVEKAPEPAPMPPPVVVEKPLQEIPPPPPVEVAPPMPKVAPPAAPPAPVFQAAQVIDPELEALFSFKTATELSEKLSQLPIGDIKKAMGLNERISTQNELFGGDANAFETAVDTLNQLRNYEEAKDFLVKNVAERFNWLGKERKDKAKEFIKLIKRRY